MTQHSEKAPDLVYGREYRIGPSKNPDDAQLYAIYFGIADGRHTFYSTHKGTITRHTCPTTTDPWRITRTKTPEFWLSIRNHFRVEEPVHSHVFKTIEAIRKAPTIENTTE